MITTSIFWLRIAACFYAVGLVHSMLALVRKRTGLYPLARGTFRIGAILHGVAIVDLGMATGHIPVDNFFQTLSLCAFLIAVLFLAVEWRYHFASTAVAHFPLVFLMTLVGDGAARGDLDRRARNVVRDPYRAGAGRIRGSRDHGRGKLFLFDPRAPAQDEEIARAFPKAAAARDVG